MLNFSQFVVETKEINFVHKETGSKGKIVHEKDGHLLFTGLETPEHSRNKGGANHVLKQALTYADKHKKNVRLNAIAHDDDGDQNKLIGFYKKHGFDHQEGKPKYMLKRTYKQR